MPADSSRPSLQEARKATADAAAETERAIADLAKHTQRVVHDGLDGLSGPARDYADYAGERFEDVQRRVVAHINEKPVASAAAALGIGVVIGFLLAGRGR